MRRSASRDFIPHEDMYMAFNDLFKVYPNRNRELRTVATTLYEFGKTIAAEPSSAHTNGLDAHALKRQRSYVTYAKAMIEALNAKPIPDNPATHPTDLPIDFSVPYVTFTTDVGGSQIPLNEATQLLAETWMFTAVELAKSNSASLAGSLVDFDHERAINNLDVLNKLLDEIEARPMLDLPETAEPGSTYVVPGAKK
jgi:hypothetical protein